MNEGKIFTLYWTTPIAAKPSPWEGTNWPPSSCDPSQGFLFVCVNDVIGQFVSEEAEKAESGKRPRKQSAPEQKQQYQWMEQTPFTAEMYLNNTAHNAMMIKEEMAAVAAQT